MELIGERYQISFLPWTGLKKTYKIGPVDFWPFPDEAESRVENQEMRSHLDRYFRSYLDNTGQPVHPIIVCSHGDNPFRTLTAIEYMELRCCCDILIFTAIAPQVRNAVSGMNRSFGPPSSDAFEFVTQNFQLGSEYINVRAGSRTSAGWKIGEITFSMPWSVGGSFGVPNEQLLTSFNKCFEPAFPSDLRERLLRSLEWFRLAHIESEQVSDQSKAVMMATAFEILLQFPKSGKRRYLVEYVENNISSHEFKRAARTDHKGKSFDLSLAGCWAWDFYELRSKIVHGDPIDSSDLVYSDWITHLIVADLVFLECVEREFLKNRCIGDNVYSCYEKIAWSSPEEEKKKIFQLLTRWFLGFDEVHKKLGWRSEEE